MKLLKSCVNFFKKQELSLLHYLLLLYVYLIPLWPKLPLKNINYTYIAIRYEDLFVALVVLVFVFDFIFKRVKLKKDIFLWLIPLFWIAVIASVLSGFYLTRTVVTLELGLLHAFRRVQYMIIFFVAFATIKNVKKLKFYLNHILFVVFIVSIYGIGQKFLGWPAVQTMNPHYSKGYLLTLDSFARISSTFGGHYDLAAYLVFMMPLTLGMFLVQKKMRYFLVFFVSLVALILTASRVSYVAYLVTIPVYLLSQKRFRLLAVVIALTVILTPLSDTLTKRINRTFRQELVWVSPETGKTIVPRDNTSLELPVGDFVIKSNNPNLQQTTEQVVLVKKEIKETIIKEAQKEGKTLSEADLNQQVEEAFSKLTPISSVLPDISFTTRLQVEWPRAVKALVRNPLLGTGVSSITESTDNDYLRSLGETGLIGFLLFALILLNLQLFFLKLGLKFRPLQPLFWGVLFGGLALLINALYIDVFEASKVALIIWLVWGMFYKLKYLPDKELNVLTSNSKK